MTAPNEVKVDFRGDGLLWLINRTVFHPRGFALGYDDNGGFTLFGNGDEPWSFQLENEDELFAKVEAVLAKVRK